MTKKKKKRRLVNILKRRERKNLKRKKRIRSKKEPDTPMLKRITLRQAFSKKPLWPLYEVLVNEGWEATSRLTQILVARKLPERDDVAVGAFLVDLACLGVKDAMSGVVPMKQYRKLRKDLSRGQTLIPADLNLVAKIIREGVEYAHNLGFEPHPDFYDAKLILGDANPDACTEEIPLGGEDGKPFYISGPYDDVPAIIAQLTKKLGPEGFYYLVRSDQLEEPEDFQIAFEPDEEGIDDLP